MSAFRMLAALEIDHDEIWPRCDEYRYRLYARQVNRLSVLAAAPTMEGIGTAIAQLDADATAADRLLSDEGRIGIFDCRPDQPTGRWIVPPWSAKELP